MKTMKRIIALVAVLACLFSLFSLEAFAYNGEQYTRKNNYVSSVKCEIISNGSYNKKTWLGWDITLPAITIKNNGRGTFQYTLKDWRGGVMKKGTLGSGQSVKIDLPRPVGCTCNYNNRECGHKHAFWLTFDKPSNAMINYTVKIAGNVDIWQREAVPFLNQ